MRTFRDRLYADITQIPPALQKKHLPSLDGLRCFSILYVIASHVNEYNPGVYTSFAHYFFGGGAFGVHFFFVISGFIITTLLLIEKVNTGHISLRHFYIRRVLRIFPLAYLFLVVLILLNGIFALGILPIDFAGAFLFLKDTAMPSSWYTAHYWSLSVEEQYYLVFPFILYKGGIRTYLNFCLFFIALYFGKNVYEHYTSSRHTIADIFLSSNFLSILVGSLTSILLFKDETSARPVNGRVMTAVYIFLLFLALFTFKYPRLFGLSSLVCSSSIASGIFLLIKFPYGPVHRVLNNKWISYTGKLSFSLYIWQQLFTAHQPWKGMFPFSGSVILHLALLGLVAWLSYHYIERPFLRLKRRFKEHPFRFDFFP